MKLIVQIAMLFLLVGCSSHSSDWNFEKPDYKEIEISIKDENSNLFYDSLMNRYKVVDTTLSLEEKRHLYYGYVFHEDYSPYFGSDYDDSLSVLMQSNNYDRVTLEKIVRIGNLAVESNPFNVTAINYQLFAFDKLGDTESFQKRMTQATMIVDALMSTGKGLEIDDPIFVISTSHEYFLLNVLGFKFGGEQSLMGQCDYLTIQENDADVKGLYFDVSPCLNSLSKFLKEE